MMPVYVEPYLGAGSTFLHLLDPSLVALCSWMGGKRRDAADHLALLGLHPRDPVACVLGDASWWGWVWPTVLDPVEGPEVSAMLRFWRGRDPRALWFWLRDVGPMPSRVEAAAQILWLQARAASGVPVWWEGTERLHHDQWGEYYGWDRQFVDDRGSGLVQDRGWKSATTATRALWPATQSHAGVRLLQEASTQIDDAGQRQARDPRVAARRLVPTTHGDGQPPGAPYAAGRKGPALVQWSEDGTTRPGNAKGFIGGPALLASDGRGDPRLSGQRTTREDRLLSHGGADGGGYDAGQKGKTGAGGIVDPGTIADRADAIRRVVAARGAPHLVDQWRQDAYGPHCFHRTLTPGPMTRILHTDALSLAEEWAPRLGTRGRWYLDPPYQGATGYPVSCPREEVLRVADLAARSGGRAVLSEAVGLAGELGPGWTSTQLRQGPKPEWVTTYGCDVRAHLPPLLRMLG